MILTKFQQNKKRKKIILALIAIKEARQRQIYIRDIFKNRVINGENFLVAELESDPEYYRKYFRMNKDSFEEIYLLVSSYLHHASTHAYPISPKTRLAITLRFLACGSSKINLAMGYRVSPSSIGKIVREIMAAIIKVMQPKHLPSPTCNTWIESEKMFREKWNFPFCIGAIDGKHVRVKCPQLSGSLNFNYKGYFSKVLMALVGPDYRFIVIDIGAPGSSSDGAIFSESAIYKKMEKKELQIPNNGIIGSRGIETPYVIVGDEAFPLKPWLMRPFPGRNLDMSRRIFNYRLSRARRVVENAFGILAARWRIFFSPIDGDEDLISLIVHASVILHNFLRIRKDSEVFGDSESSEGQGQRGNWREEMEQCKGFVDIPQVGSNNYSLQAYTVREVFKDYFVSEEGKLNGQDAYVMRS